MEPVTLAQLCAVTGLVLLVLASGERVLYALLGAVLILYAAYLTRTGVQIPHPAPTYHRVLQTAQSGVYLPIKQPQGDLYGQPQPDQRA